MKSRLQKSFSVPVVLTLLLFVVGCDMPAPSERKKDSPFDAISGYQLISSYNDTLSAFLRYSGSIVMGPNNVNSKVAVANAIFLDSTLSAFVDPASVSCNSNSLSRNSTETVYSQGHSDLYIGKSNAAWSITGYQGSNYSFSDALPSDLVITNLKAGDTVSKAAGFTVNYNGGAAGGDLAIAAFYDAGLTRYYVNPAEPWDGGSGEFHSVTPDDGSITYTSGNLSGITTGKMIKVVLTHWGYAKHNSMNNRKIGALRTISVEIPLYLAP